MQNLRILNSRETKQLMQKLESQYGFDTKKKELDFIFLVNKDNRLYTISKNLSQLDIEYFRTDSIGLYFGEVYKNSVRLSIEGAQIVGRHATKNILLLEYKQMLEWIKGNDIDAIDCGDDFVIVKYKNEKTNQYDILGCGKYKQGKLMNYVSKSRRLVVVNS